MHVTASDQDRNVRNEVHPANFIIFHIKSTVKPPARVAVYKNFLVFSFSCFHTIFQFPDARNSEIPTRPPVFNTRYTSNDLAAGRAHRTHGRVSIRRVQLTIRVAGFIHGSADLNPLQRIICRMLQRENLRSRSIQFPTSGTVTLYFHGECENISSSALRLSILRIHQDMAPQISSTPVDT